MAPQKQLEDPRVTGESNTSPQINPSTSKVVAGGKQCAPRATFTPIKTCSATVYRCLKRRLGRSLRRAHCKGNLVPSRKQAAHQLPGTKGSFSGSTGVPKPLPEQHSPNSHRQYYSGFLHKQGRGDEVGPLVCPSVEDTDVVHQETGYPQGPAHSRVPECGGRQTIQTGPNYSNRVVSPPRGIPGNVRQVAHAASQSICHKIQQQAEPVCFPSARPLGFNSGRPQPAMGGSGPVCFSTSSHLGQSSGKTTQQLMPQNHSDCSGVAQHALVLGPGDNVQPNPSEPSPLAQPANPTIQSYSSQESIKSKPSCLAPRASAIKEQGLSEAVAARIEAPQRGSTRSVYEAKWSIFTKCCLGNQVDFRAPPVKAIADFLMYLIQDKKLQPSTIDGYRSAIADKLGNLPLNISKDENLTRLLDSFHRDRPKGRRGIPSWNLSLVLHQLTKAPFEPIKQASLKHLTFKTFFLLALGSGKRRSEIHACDMPPSGGLFLGTELIPLFPYLRAGLLQKGGGAHKTLPTSPAINLLGSS